MSAVDGPGPKSSPSYSDGSIRSIERAFRILRVLETARKPLRLSDLSLAVEMPKATVQRLLAVLDKHRFVVRQHGRYQIGMAVVPLAYSFLVGNSLVQAALPVLQELAAESEETATLYVRQGTERVVVQRVEGRQPLRYTMPVVVGQRLTLLLGAAGHVLLAHMPEDERRALLEQSGPIETSAGETLSLPTLHEQLEQIRRQGSAVSRDERTLGIVSIAAPVICSEKDVVAALSVTGTAGRLDDEKINNLVVEVRRAARAIAERYDHT